MKKLLPQPVVKTGGDPFYPTTVSVFVHNLVKSSDFRVVREISRLIVSFMQRNSRLLHIVFPKRLNLVFHAA